MNRRLCSYRTTSGRGGFTLIEMVVAMALLSVILAAVYGTFSVASEAVLGMGDSMTRMHEARTVLDMIRTEIESADMTDLEGGPFVVRDRDFYGADASELWFTTFGTMLDGPVPVSYYLKEKNKKLMLMKTIEANPMSGDGPVEAEMVEDVESFLVEVLVDGSWRKNFDDKAIPPLVRVTFVIHSGDGSLTLTITTEPRQRTRA